MVGCFSVTYHLHAIGSEILLSTTPLQQSECHEGPDLNFYPISVFQGTPCSVKIETVS